ncbi:hypothetical protein D3C85_1478880 [compost metagenome]
MSLEVIFIVFWWLNMTLTQKNVFGDNIINVNPSRELLDRDKQKLLEIINGVNATSAVIRYEHGGETQEFARIVGSFLHSNNISVNFIQVMMSEIERNEFSIMHHPNDASFVIIKIGPIQ